MAGVNLTISGTKEVAETLDKFEKNVKNGNATNKELGSILVKQASALAPEKTGNLRKSIRYEATDSQVQIYAGNERVTYAPIIEYGWQAGNREPKSFIGRALNDNMKTIVQKYDDLVNDSIKKYDLD
jgi:HK97 gp10 family phage protein